MRGIICYYSGSGNTRLVCQYIVKNVRDVEIDLFNIVKGGLPELQMYDIVGFATFTNFLAPPFLVQTFIERLPQQVDKPAFVFNTYGFMSGKTLSILNEWATTRGFKVIAGHSLHTPESYPPMIAKGRGNKQAPDLREMGDFENFISELDKLIHILKNGGEVRGRKIKMGLLNSLFPAFPLTKARQDMGEKHVDEPLCTECGICEKLCPYKAIMLTPKPLFYEDKCYGCWACYNHCPIQAIYTEKYRGIGHYPNPHARLKERLRVQ